MKSPTAAAEVSSLHHHNPFVPDPVRVGRLAALDAALPPDRDEVDPALGATDPDATVTGRQDDLRVELIATTTLPGQLLQQRLRWLAGSAWELRNVTAA